MVTTRSQQRRSARPVVSEDPDVVTPHTLSTASHTSHRIKRKADSQGSRDSRSKPAAVKKCRLQRDVDDDVSHIQAIPNAMIHTPTPHEPSEVQTGSAGVLIEISDSEDEPEPVQDDVGSEDSRPASQEVAVKTSAGSVSDEEVFFAERTSTETQGVPPTPVTSSQDSAQALSTAMFPDSDEKVLVEGLGSDHAEPWTPPSTSDASLDHLIADKENIGGEQEREAIVNNKEKNNSHSHSRLGSPSSGSSEKENSPAKGISAARRNLQGGLQIYGRARESRSLQKFLRDPDSGSALFIVGNPGTGKTRLALQTIQDLGLQDATSFYNLKHHSINLRKTLQEIERERKDILVLDEVDEILRLQDGKKHLSRVFAASGGKVIGISNVLNLTHRMKHIKPTPKTLAFTPYEATHLESIAREILGDAEGGIVTKPALDLWAKKMKTLHGDFRRASNTLERILAHAEAKGKTQVDVQDVMDVLHSRDREKQLSTDDHVVLCAIKYSPLDDFEEVFKFYQQGSDRFVKPLGHQRFFQRLRDLENLGYVQLERKKVSLKRDDVLRLLAAAPEHVKILMGKVRGCYERLAS